MRLIKRKYLFNPRMIDVKLLIFLNICAAILLFLFVFIMLEFHHTNASKPQYSANEAVKECKESASPRECYIAYLSRSVQDTNMKKTIAILVQIQKQDPSTLECHVMAHKISIAALAKDPSKWKELLSQIDYYMCNFGFLHGILEGRERYDPTFSLTATTIPQICTVIEQAKHSTLFTQTCAHIIGHLLLVTTKGNAQKAFSICESVPDAMKHECAAGVSMENFTRDNLVLHGFGTYIPWSDETIAAQEQLCNTLSPDLAGGCWQEIAHLYDARENHNQLAVFQDCSRAPSLVDRDFCYIHAIQGFVSNPHANQQSIQQICEVYSPTSLTYQQCVETVVYALAYISQNSRNSTALYCQNVDTNVKSDCQNARAKDLVLFKTPQQFAD